MGYALYEIDGQPCGYAVEDVCNRDDCRTIIDRGVAFACGGEPGAGSDYCAGYFCGAHLVYTGARDPSTTGAVCDGCVAQRNGDVEPEDMVDRIDETRTPAPIIHYAEETPPSSS